MLLAGLADDDAELLRQAANGIAAEWADRKAARLLLDAAPAGPAGHRVNRSIVRDGCPFPYFHVTLFVIAVTTPSWLRSPKPRRYKNVTLSPSWM